MQHLTGGVVVEGERVEPRLVWPMATIMCGSTDGAHCSESASAAWIVSALIVAPQRIVGYDTAKYAASRVPGVLARNATSATIRHCASTRVRVP